MFVFILFAYLCLLVFLMLTCFFNAYLYYPYIVVGGHILVRLGGVGCRSCNTGGSLKRENYRMLLSAETLLGR